MTISKEEALAIVCEMENNEIERHSYESNSCQSISPETYERIDEVHYNNMHKINALYEYIRELS